MTPIEFLIDTSALTRVLDKPGQWTGWEDLVKQGVIGVCPLTELELLYGARSIEQRRTLVEQLNEFLLPVHIDDAAYSRAWEVQYALTLSGQQRSAGAVDLVVAAVAEHSSLTVLHYDRDFETIAQITKQPTAWLAPPGSV